MLDRSPTSLADAGGAAPRTEAPPSLSPGPSPDPSPGLSPARALRAVPELIAISGADVVTPEGVVKDHAVLVEGATIAAIVENRSIPRGALPVRVDGGCLVPGFIDIQVNGGGDVLFNDAPSVPTLERIAQAHARFGSTGLMPTLISDDLEVVEQAIDAVEQALEQGVAGILGLHIEGPFLNASKRGIHDLAKIRRLDEAALRLLSRPSRGRRMVTLAPELAPEGAIRRLREAGVLVFAGHSDATWAQTTAALAEGLTGFTHLFNAMSQLGSREPGMVGATLDDSASCFGVIADGRHVHFATLRIALRAAGAHRAILVSDAMPTVGGENDSFELNGRLIRVSGAACVAADGTLAGSNLDMASAVRNTVEHLGRPIEEASRMASANPARALGLEGLTGAIRPGLRADLVHLSDALAVTAVWRGGQRLSV